MQRSDRRFRLIDPLRLSILLLAITSLPSSTSYGEEGKSSEEAIAAYADAANFQSGGAIELAIEAWKEFLSDFPEDALAPKSAHYLGVCYMQQEDPNYKEATTAFGLALQDKDYDLREESLANQGWCLYARSSSGDQVRPELLKQAQTVFQTLTKEYPRSRFLDRSYFYSGEAAYALGKKAEAVAYYDKLLSLPEADQSPLRCDTLYAKGVALEEQGRGQKAIAAFNLLLDQCAESELAIDVQMRLGDLQILNQSYGEAIDAFQVAFDSADSKEDKAYCLFRQAFALVRSGKPGDASEKYNQLAEDFGDSQYAASAKLASGQSAYRSGDLDKAASAFSDVLESGSTSDSTEAAHWLARILLNRGEIPKATSIAKSQLDRGAKGEYANDLALDYAEALSMNPQTVSRSIDLFEKVYNDSIDDDLAPRALYNAAFSALQAGDSSRALTLAAEFTKRFRDDPLLTDVRFISAESNFANRNFEKAFEQYKDLLRESPKNHPERPLWVLRSLVASNANRTFKETISIARKESQVLQVPAEIAEAWLQKGQAELVLSQFQEAARSFAKSADSDKKGPRWDEAKLLLGQATLRTGEPDQAIKSWKQVIDHSPMSTAADQARYKIAQQLASAGDSEDALRLYQQVANSEVSPALKPYAQYGVGFTRLQLADYEAATITLTEMIKQFNGHPMQADAWLSRGIALRNLGKYDEASRDFAAFLDTDPSGINLGHALYELALVDVQQNRNEDAVRRLKRLLTEVPEYPSKDKATYELAWALQENGDSAGAAMQFQSLVNNQPESELAPESAYFVAQRYYVDKNWEQAAENFAWTAAKATDNGLKEKAFYRWGWSHYKDNDFSQAELAFSQLADQFPDGKLSFDAKMMVGECQFKKGSYQTALKAYQICRDQIIDQDQSAKSLRDRDEQQVRELVLLHGGQSAAQLEDWNLALDWYNELRTRFPASAYLPQVFYETGFAYQQLDQIDRALKLYGEVAKKYRTEIAARSRFMMGEIYFGQRKFDAAIPEFQRVMFGFGAEKAPDGIKNWQAKSGFEAGRCSELLMQSAKTASAREKARKIATSFYSYVTTRHAGHPLQDKAQQRLEALNKE